MGISVRKPLLHKKSHTFFVRCLSRFCRPSQPLVACSSHRTLLELQHSHPERIPQKLIPQSKFIFGERGCTKFAPLNLTSHLQAAELGPNTAEHTHTSKSPLAADTPRLQAKEMRCVSVTQPYAHRGREKRRAQGCHRGRMPHPEPLSAQFPVTFTAWE